MGALVQTNVLAYERLFDLDLQLLADSVLLVISIFVLYILLSYLLFNPARNLLKNRQEKIKNDIDTAAKDKEEAAKMKAEYEERIKNIDKEAETILSDARKKALKKEAKIVEEAKEEAARIISRAKEEAELEKKHAADDVKKEIISIASIMAGKVVSASIDTTVQDGLIEETLKEMGDETWLS